MAGVAAALGSVLLLKLAPHAWVWTAALWAAACFGAARGSAGSALAAVWFNAGFAFLAFGSVEAWLAFGGSGAADTYHYSKPLTRPDDVLGYAPNADTTLTATKRHGDEVVYEVRYSFDENGHRVTPPAAADSECVVFFGGSFAFGMGVEDAESMPWQVVEHSGGRLHAVNLGFNGYGAHQMLAAIEAGLLDEVPGCEPRAAIYLALVAHTSRAVGLSPWDRHGPRYVRNGDGRVHRAGHFDDGIWRGKVLPRLHQSEIFSRLLSRTPDRSTNYVVTPEEVDLYVAIVAAAARRFEAAHPGARFHVLLWDEPASEHYTRILDGLRRAGLSIHRMSELYPGFDRLEMKADGIERKGLALSELDDHPSAKTHAAIADFVIGTILGGETGS